MRFCGDFIKSLPYGLFIGLSTGYFGRKVQKTQVNCIRLARGLLVDVADLSVALRQAIVRMMQCNFLKGEKMSTKKPNRLRRLLSHISHCFGFKFGWWTREITFGRKKSKNNK